ncbi:MAG TPA: acetylglutamate kinase [Bryobacteraceae bacterium]
MRIVIKLGGTLLDSTESRQRIAHELAEVHRLHSLVVVHGGGKQMTRFLEERGVKSQFVNGLRVTTEETLDALIKVLAGSVNQHLVAALIEAGTPAVGLSGVDGNLVVAEQMDPALGAVGKVTQSRPELLNVLTQNRFLPVVACLAGDGRGGFFNVNGDQMAVACATAFAADRLVFLTDVDGVLDSSGNTIAELDPSGVEKLIDSGVAKGGMQAKLNAAVAAVQGGVDDVCIVSGQRPGAVADLLAGRIHGTRLARVKVAK